MKAVKIYCAGRMNTNYNGGQEQRFGFFPNWRDNYFEDDTYNNQSNHEWGLPTEEYYFTRKVFGIEYTYTGPFVFEGNYKHMGNTEYCDFPNSKMLKASDKNNYTEGSEDAEEWSRHNQKPGDKWYISSRTKDGFHWANRQSMPHHSQSPYMNIHFAALDAVKDCDLVLVSMAELERAHGTLVEIGYAKALGKTVIIVELGVWYEDNPPLRSPESTREQVWFAYATADTVIKAYDWEEAFHQLSAILQIGGGE